MRLRRRSPVVARAGSAVARSLSLSLGQGSRRHANQELIELTAQEPPAPPVPVAMQVPRRYEAVDLRAADVQVSRRVLRAVGAPQDRRGRRRRPGRRHQITLVCGCQTLVYMCQRIYPPPLIPRLPPPAHGKRHESGAAATRCTAAEAETTGTGPQRWTGSPRPRLPQAGEQIQDLLGRIIRTGASKSNTVEGLPGPFGRTSVRAA